jgi:hypothetical protein
LEAQPERAFDISAVLLVSGQTILELELVEMVLELFSLSVDGF